MIFSCSQPDFPKCPPDPYQSQCFLEHGGERVLLHHKDVGRFALHREAVGLAVEAHRTHKVLELGQQIGQLEAQKSPDLNSRHRKMEEALVQLQLLPRDPALKGSRDPLLLRMVNLLY